jgi:hypothetical protein
MNLKIIKKQQIGSNLGKSSYCHLNLSDLSLSRLVIGKKHSAVHESLKVAKCVRLLGLEFCESVGNTAPACGRISRTQCGKTHCGDTVWRDCPFICSFIHPLVLVFSGASLIASS